MRMSFICYTFALGKRKFSELTRFSGAKVSIFCELRNNVNTSNYKI